MVKEKFVFGLTLSFQNSLIRELSFYKVLATKIKLERWLNMREKAKSSITSKLETNNFAKMYSVNNTLIACYDVDIYEFSSSRNSKLIRLFFLFQNSYDMHHACKRCNRNTSPVTWSSKESLRTSKAKIKLRTRMNLLNLCAGKRKL